MIVSLKSQAVDHKQHDIMKELDIPEQTTTHECFFAFDFSLVQGVLQDPFEDDMCRIIYKPWIGLVVLMEPYDKVFKLWRASRGEF